MRQLRQGHAASIAPQPQHQTADRTPSNLTAANVAEVDNHAPIKEPEADCRSEQDLSPAAILTGPLADKLVLNTSTKAQANFLLLPEEIRVPEACQELLRPPGSDRPEGVLHRWLEVRPAVLVRFTSGTTLRLTRSQELNFERSLATLAHRMRCWLFTDGIARGAAALVGGSVRAAKLSLPCIGIAPAAHIRRLGSRNYPASTPASTKAWLKHSLERLQDGCEKLDKNHTHFVLRASNKDKGEGEVGWDDVVGFHSELAKDLAGHLADQPQRVLVVLGGSPSSCLAVSTSLQRSCAVVLVTDGGGFAKAAAELLQRVEKLLADADGESETARAEAEKAVAKACAEAADSWCARAGEEWAAPEAKADVSKCFQLLGTRPALLHELPPLSSDAAVLTETIQTAIVRATVHTAKQEQIEAAFLAAKARRSADPLGRGLASQSHPVARRDKKLRVPDDKVPWHVECHGYAPELYEKVHGAADGGAQLTAAPVGRLAAEDKEYDVFISHATADDSHDVFTVLKNYFAGKNLKVFKPTTELSKVEHPNKDSMRDAVRRSRLVVAALSNAFFDSVYCAAEIGAATEAGITVIPVFSGDDHAAKEMDSWVTKHRKHPQFGAVFKNNGRDVKNKQNEEAVSETLEHLAKTASEIESHRSMVNVVAAMVA